MRILSYIWFAILSFKNTGTVYLVIGRNILLFGLVVQRTFYSEKVAGILDACVRNICCVFV